VLGARLALTWLSAHVSSGVGQTYYIALFARYVTLELGLSGGEFGGLYTLCRPNEPRDSSSIAESRLQASQQRLYR